MRVIHRQASASLPRLSVLSTDPGMHGKRQSAGSIKLLDGDLDHSKVSLLRLTPGQQTRQPWVLGTPA